MPHTGIMLPVGKKFVISSPNFILFDKLHILKKKKIYIFDTNKLNQLINKNDNFSEINCSYLILDKFLEFDLDSSGDIGKFNVEFVYTGN